MNLRIAVLLSIGRNPRSGRARRADRDARALELALSLTGGDHIEAIHAGMRDPALDAYLGMGIPSVTVLLHEPGHDVLPGLVAHLRQSMPDLILAGTAAEDGPGSGTLPYALASALYVPVLTDIATVETEGETLRGVQALAAGQRRRLRVTLPAIVTVGQAAPIARQSAFRLQRSGKLDVRSSALQGDAIEHRTIPARARPKRVATAAPGGSATDRLRALTQMSGGGGRNLVNPEPQEAAAAILSYLETEGIIDLPTGSVQQA